MGLENDAYFRWGYTFLVADSKLSWSDSEYLILQATEMYLRNEDKRKIGTDSLEGLISTEGKWDSLGCFGGQRFEAEVETSRGKAYIRFLVNEQTGARTSSSYVN